MTIEVVRRELLEALAALVPQAEAAGAGPSAAPAPANGTGGRLRLKVGEWLQARGREYRVKSQPDSRGRTVYVLKTCPFDPGHGDPDSCIMQAPGGKLSAQCFHNSCRGRGWKEFKEAIGQPDPEHYDPPLTRGPKLRQGGGGQAQTAPASEDGRPVIVVTTEEHLVNDQAVQAIGNDQSIFQRGGLLVRVVTDDSPAGRGIRRPFAPRIDALPPPLLRERLTANARWIVAQTDNKGDVRYKPGHPPGWCVSAVHSRSSWPNVRHLEIVVDYPVLRPDGTICCTAGYDPDTGLLLAPAGDLPAVQSSPSKEDAVAAANTLFEVVADFPFEHAAHKSAWLAALLTPLARFAFVGPAPLFLVDANVRGAGKGLLLHVIAKIITGETFTVATYTGDEDELRKRITSLALAGDRLVLFDNLEGQFGNAVLDAALTASSWEDRILGGNRMARMPLFVTWYATGNNVMVGADTARRVCHTRLESPEEKPEEREGFAHPDLLAWVGKNRQRLLAAALTILRAYCVAGRPNQELKPWGSFEGWSALVRSAVKWLGFEDPGVTRLLLEKQADVVSESMKVLLDGWAQMDPKQDGLTVAEVIQRLYKDKEPFQGFPPYYCDMQEAIANLIGKPDPGQLGCKLRSYRRRIFQGHFLDKVSSEHSAARWAVFPAKDFRTGAKHPPHPPRPPRRQGEHGEDGEDVSPQAENGPDDGHATAGGTEEGDA
jgi:hypothetical protein